MLLVCRWSALALLCGLSGLMESCGQRENAHPNLHPGEPFEKYQNTFDTQGSCANDADAATGCGSVSLAGEVVGGGFLSSDFRVTCTSAGSTFNIRIADGKHPNSSGLEIIISFKGQTSAPTQARICLLSADDPLARNTIEDPEVVAARWIDVTDVTAPLEIPAASYAVVELTVARSGS